MLFGLWYDVFLIAAGITFGIWCVSFFSLHYLMIRSKGR